MIGLEVESVEDKATALAPFTIARVISAEQHPNADRLRVCMVDTGAGDPVQVVCGAPNARTGMKSVFAPPRHLHPRQEHDARQSAPSAASRAAACCARAFELQISDDHDGIIDLPADAPVGAALCRMGRPRRSGDRDQPDAQPARLHRRARHRARSRRRRHGHVQGRRRSSRSTGEFPCPVAVRLDFGATPSLCRGFALRLVRGVKNGPSPGMAAAAAHRDRPAADQRAGRHHQLHHLRPRPAAARVRRRQGEGRPHGAPRPRRRDAARARRQDLRARRHHVRHRRRAAASNRSPASWAARRPAARRRPPTC